LRSAQIKSILCSNLLEHLEDPYLIAESILQILDPGGLIIVTVPFSYPYHKDPIDTLFRPDTGELYALFPGTEILRADIVSSNDSFAKDLFRDKKYMAKMLLRWLMPFYKFSDWTKMI